MDLEPLILEMRDRVTAFSGTLDGMAINQDHAEKDIVEIKEDFKEFKKIMWDLINVQKAQIKDLTSEDKALKVQLATGHKFIVWLSLIMSFLAGIYTLLKEVIHVP